MNFWSQIAFAFTGLELVSAMSEEIRDPQRTLPRALFGSSILIAGMYIVGTVAVLVLAPAGGYFADERRVSCGDGRIGGAGSRISGHRRGDAGDCRKCGRRRAAPSRELRACRSS